MSKPAHTVTLVYAPAEGSVEAVDGERRVPFVVFVEELAGDTGLVGGGEIVPVLTELTLVVVGAEFERVGGVELLVLGAGVAAVDWGEGVVAWETQALVHVVHDVCAADERFYLARVVRTENAVILGGSTDLVLAIVVESGTYATEVTGLHALGGLVAAAGTQLTGIVNRVLKGAGEAYTEIYVIRACVNGCVGSCRGGLVRTLETHGAGGGLGEGTNITERAREVPVVAFERACGTGRTSGGGVSHELFKARPTFTCVHGCLSEVLVRACGVAVLAGGLAGLVLVRVATTLLANVRVSGCADEVLEVTCRAGVTVFWGHLTLSRAVVAPREVLTERGIALTGRAGSGARGAERTRAAGHTHASVLVGIGRTDIAQARGRLKHIAWVTLATVDPRRSRRSLGGAVLRTWRTGAVVVILVLGTELTHATDELARGVAVARGAVGRRV
jgi:hypothetical protein